MSTIFSSYRFTVSGISVVPDLNSTYTNNGSTFSFLRIDLTSGAGFLYMYRSLGSAEPQASGTLSKDAGTGDATISFSAENGFTLSISRNPAYPRDWHLERYNQYSIDTADGGRVVYDNGPSVLYGTLELRSVPTSSIDGNGKLRDFFETVTIFGKNPFAITPPSGTDIGKGTGTVIKVYFNGGTSLGGVFNFVGDGTIYDVNISYKEVV